MRRPFNRTSVALEPRPRSEIAAEPGANPAWNLSSNDAAFCGSRRNTSVTVATPDFLMSSAVMVFTGDGPTDSVVGIIEPVTTTFGISVGWLLVVVWFWARTDAATMNSVTQPASSILRIGLCG